MIQYGANPKKRTPTRRKKPAIAGKTRKVRGGAGMRLLVLEGKLAVRDADMARLEQQVQALEHRIERIVRAERVVGAISTLLKEILSLHAE